MSSWVSHLPPVAYRRVVGLGMAENCGATPRLDKYVVQEPER